MYLKLAWTLAVKLFSKSLVYQATADFYSMKYTIVALTNVISD